MSVLHPRGVLPCGFIFATSFMVACQSGGYDAGPSAGHPYPPPGDFGVVETGGTTTQTSDKGPQKGQPSSPCTQKKTPWPDWNAADKTLGLSPRSAFLSIDHEIKTGLHWSKAPADLNGLAWNVANTQTHLTVQLRIDPQANARIPVFVTQTPNAPDQPAGACPDYWELPASINLSTGDLALREQKIPATLSVGTGGVAMLSATMDAKSLAGKLQWTTPLAAALRGEQSTESTTSSESTTTSTQSSVNTVEMRAWLAKGIMWANLRGALSSGRTFELADGNADDPRCEDGQRLRVSLHHPFGKLSAHRVLESLRRFSQFVLHWQGQEPKPLRLAAIAPPKEVCIDVLASTGPSATLQMPLRMTFVDDEQQRSLTMTPKVRASLNLSKQSAITMDLRYSAFSRSQESLQNFLTRHAIALPLSQAPTSGIFELAMQMQGTSDQTLTGSLALKHFSQSQDCNSSTGDQSGDSQCDALHGQLLRRGSLNGTKDKGKK